MQLDQIKKELEGSPFKTVFKATLAFYLAQATVSILALVGIGLVFGAVALTLALLS